MKKILSLVLLAAFMTMATSAFAAADFGNTVFGLYSAASAAVKTSGAVSVRGFKTKSMAVSGVTLTSNPSSLTYKNMSGTVLVQCAPTSTGPWSTCIANDYGQTAVSRTTNGLFSWSDSVAYIRMYWTSGTVGGKLKAWLNWTE